MEQQVEQAIQIVYNPAGSNQDLVRQALEFLNRVRESPEGWTFCLPLITRAPRTDDAVRLFALEVVNIAVKTHAAELGLQNLIFLKESLMEYLRLNYQPNAGPKPLKYSIEGKLIQAIATLFTVLYTTSWTTFFDELLALTMSVPRENGGTGQMDNLPGIMLYLRVMTDIHDEIAETAFYHTTDQLKRNAIIKDYVRDHDMQKLVTTWQEILTQWRNVNAEVVERVLHVFAKWVSWIDISLVVNDHFLGHLADLLQGSGSGLEVTKRRKAATVTLSEIAGKGMKPDEKLELIGFLRLTDVVKTLISLPEMRSDAEADEDIDFAEAVGGLVNRIVQDLVSILNGETGVSPEGRQTAEGLLTEWVPFLLVIFRHEYDDVSVTGHPALSELLSYLRKEKKTTNTLLPTHHVMLEPILEAVVRKMRFDNDLDWEEGDPHVEAEFQELRKKIKSLQDALASTDIDLYCSAISVLVVNTLDRCRHGAVDWRDLELALYQMFLFGEVAVKANGLYLEGQPNGVAAEALVVMMAKMMELEQSIYAHPSTRLLYIENVVRYSPFFEHRRDFVAPALGVFIQSIHDSNLKVKTRAWYLFLRVVKLLRNDITRIAPQAIDLIRDLLVVKANVPGSTGGEEEDISSDDESPADAVFNSQIYLFEAAGSIASSAHLSVVDQKAVLHTILNPLFSDVEANLEAAKRNDQVAIIQIHHNIMAMGQFAKGFADGLKLQGPTTEDRSLTTEFQATAEGIVSALENLKSSKQVREAAGFAFARMVGVLGLSILRLLPRWIEGLLAENSSKGELSIFLRLLDQLIHGFKKDMSDYLDRLLTPLCSKVFQIATQPTTGTDDQLETGELKREYLTFLSTVLNSDLSEIFMSPANQPNFQALLETVEHFAKDVSDPHAERMAISLMARMSSVWGGPEIPETILPEDKKKSTPSAQKGQVPQEPVPGFDRFMITFSEICWAVPANPAFDAKDAQGRLVLGEVATLQKVIYGRTGTNFVTYLQGTYFPSINFPEQAALEYLSALQQLDHKKFKKFFQNFVTQSVG
ncbi:pre-tRNA nuclear export protein [Orbilia blumenaviensis]|uniref:Exportin-T n=1 Tax=Orbilia blumenaviensis TaxID=1796055 RepID=A0AAV9VGR3_9PEZI